MPIKVLARAVCWPDSHQPFHDQTAVDVARNVVEGWAPDVVYFLGDFFDCYAVSFYPKSVARRQSLVEELEMGKDFLDRFKTMRKKTRPKKSKYALDTFIKGNHEDRLPRFIASRCPELAGVYNENELLGLSGMNVIPYGDYTSFGSVDITHDFGFSGKHAHIRAATEYGSSIIHGHTHGAGSIYFGTGRAKKHVAISAGWLGSAPFADYAKRKQKERSWMHSFVTIDRKSVV